ncbi:uncharacterized protein Aud_004017 [Aspergillus udagawae]|uniref:Heterokaryon incompatibility domain-containing protein n=1 Tax=Aspergillus udagawae TaxID=91492 RepID=A0A8E0QRL9_9EURO|nr:uncharacterized protein Aud_004017 [Aspergillus udagawae]GIC87631.1 hypothetical protein Aud_004017 [Aspergillus udagawae]
MVLYQDPETGVAWDARDLPPDIAPQPDPKYEEYRRIRLNQDKHMNDEDQLQTVLPDYNGASDTHVEIGLEESLLVHESGLPVTTCANAIDRPGMWARMNEQRAQVRVDPEEPFMNQLASLCVRAQIRHCSHQKCVKERDSMKRYAPRCEWRRFREWALALVACQLSFGPEQKLTLAYTHLKAVAPVGYSLLDLFRWRKNEVTGTFIENENKKRTVDVFGVCEVIYWMLTIQTSLGYNAGLETRWLPDFLPTNVAGPAVKKAVQKAHKLGICPYRLWNLAIVSERKYVDFPGLMETATKHPSLKHEDHQKCTTGLCYQTTIDSTRAKQCHKCGKPPTCDGKRVLFDPERLNESIRNGGRTVWSVNEPFHVSQDQPYVAISHVWADGTGIGLGKVGEVNCCLFNYFAGITRTLGCDALWWDTISIPTEKEARKKAINEMHKNYSSARCTVVHDQYLTNFLWSDDGSPCLAIVLSSWLTRGWTALELIMSPSVKVIFKGTSGPVIKDLDSDILANDPSRCSRAHWIASTIIRRLRRPIENITDLITVLKPRSTSWPRDKMVIAGLLSRLDDCDYSLQSDEITKAIMLRVSKIHPSSVLHGQPTMRDSGAWSWCPSSLYDIPVESMGDTFMEGGLGDLTCLIEAEGILAGAWHFRFLRREDSLPGRLIASSAHPSVIWKVANALRHWRHCLLLREQIIPGGPSLLVTTVSREGRFIHCRYVGAVLDVNPPPIEDLMNGYDYFKMGHAENKPSIKARKLIPPNPHPSTEDEKYYQWLDAKLWIGNEHPTGKLLVTQFHPEDGGAEGCYLLIKDRPISVKPYSRDASRAVVYGGPEVTRSKEAAFQVSPNSSYDAAVTRARMTLAWPPPTIPAGNRIGIQWITGNPLPGSNCSGDFLRLETSTKLNSFAAIEPQLYTPGKERPYRGIWAGVFPFRTGLYPDHRWEFLLFHQPKEKRLEVIKLTGDESSPRGSYAVIVDDLNKVTRICTEEEWPGAPAVPAMGYAMERNNLYRKLFPLHPAL